VIYQDQLAHLLGLEGIALLHAFAREYDRGFTEAQLAEIRVLLDSRQQLGNGATAKALTTVAGYRSPRRPAAGTSSSPAPERQ